MTDPTPEPTFTAEEYDTQADACALAAQRYFVEGGKRLLLVPVLLRTESMLRFAARRARQTCENCKFAKVPYIDTLAGEETEGTRGCRKLGTNVPLTVHGQPFGCEAWEAKPVSPSDV